MRSLSVSLLPLGVPLGPLGVTLGPLTGALPSAPTHALQPRPGVHIKHLAVGAAGGAPGHAGQEHSAGKVDAAHPAALSTLARECGGQQHSALSAPRSAPAVAPVARRRQLQRPPTFSLRECSAEPCARWALASSCPPIPCARQVARCPCLER